MSTAVPLTRERLERWRAVQPKRFRVVAAPVVLWLVVIVLATALSPEGGCTPEHPCGAGWLDAVEVALALSAPLVLLWTPALGAVLSVVAAVLFAGRELEAGALPLWLSVGLPVLVVLATANAEAGRQRRQSAAARLLEDVPRDWFPGQTPAVRRGSVRLALAGLVLAVAPALLAYGVGHGRQVAAEERAAPHVVGTVVSHGENGYRLTVEVDGDRHEIDSLDAKDYPVGSTQELLELPDGGMRLAVERYDPASWLFGALLCALLGASFGLRARADRRSLQALVSSLQPVHRARIAWTVDGGHLLPVDDDGREPLLRLRLVPADLVRPEAEDETQLETVDLYGVPLVGHSCAAVTDGGLRLVPLGRARRGHPRANRAPEAAVPVEAGASPEQLTAARAALTRVEWWRAPLGAGLVLVALVGGFLVARWSESAFATLWRCALLASLAFDGLVQLVTRVQLTEEALVHDGPTTRRTVPWNALSGVTVVDDVVLAKVEDKVVPLTWLPRRPWARGRASRRTWAHRWAMVLATEAGQAPREPRRSPTTEPRLHGALVAIGFTTAVLLGLWSRGGL